MLRECRYCQSKISGNAKVCLYCGRHQSWWVQNIVNIGQVAAILVAVVALCQLYLASQQLDEARQAREATSVAQRQAEEAKNIAQTAAQQASDAAARIKEVKERVESQSAAIDDVAKQAQSAKESLLKAQEIIAEEVKREELRRYAMVNIFGEEARDVWGLKGNILATLKHADVFKRVYIAEEKGIKFGGTLCKKEKYIKDVKTLVESYPLIPYAHVILAFCLKLTDDSSWRSVAENARVITEDMLRIRPHVATYDVVYGFLMNNVLEMDIPKDSPFLEWRDGKTGGYYRPLISTEHCTGQKSE